MGAALTQGVIGVDMNADLPQALNFVRAGETPIAAWRLDVHGNPTGNPRRFFYDLSGTAQHRDAQVRHALTRLLHWAQTCGVKAIAVEDLDFTADKTREKHGRKRRFRQLISGMPTGRLRARLTSMPTTPASRSSPSTRPTPAAGAPSTGKSPSPATTERPLATTRQPWRSKGAPRDIRSGDGRHRPRTTRAIVQGIGPSRPDRASPGVREPAPRIPGPRTRSAGPGPRTRSAGPGRGTNAGDQNAQHRSGRSAEHESWQQGSLPLSL